MATRKETIRTKYGPFLCTFERERDMGGYAVEASGMQGAVSWGKTLAEAKRMIAEAIEGIVEMRAIVHAERRGTIRIVRGASSKLVA